jgi:hypothetical protein
MRSRVMATACSVALLTWLPIVAAPAAHADNLIFTPARDAAPYGPLPAAAVPGATLPEVPVAVLLPAIGALVLWLVVRRRRRSEESSDSSD